MTTMKKIKHLKSMRILLFDLIGENTDPDLTIKLERAKKSIQELLEHYIEYNAQ